MKCSKCSQADICRYSADRRRLLCRACYEAEAGALRDARRAALVGQRRMWERTLDHWGRSQRVPVTVVGHAGGWLLVAEDDGTHHRVREHNTSRVSAERMEQQP